MAEQRTIRVEQRVNVAPAEVFRAFTGRVPLRMWLCADASRTLPIDEGSRGGTSELPRRDGGDATRPLRAARWLS